MQAPVPLFFYGVDLVSGVATLINDNVNCWNGTTNCAINAIGFNVLDDYIYGESISGTKTNLIRIGAGGLTGFFPDIPISFPTVVGDVTPDGHYWILDIMSGTSTARHWAEYDLSDSASPSFGNLVSSGPVTAIFDLEDWAYVPGAGNFLWAMAHTRTAPYTYIELVKFDLTAKTFTSVKNLGSVATNGVGACYASADGYLYGSDNTSGIIWRVNVVTLGPVEIISNGPKSSSNDGARCVNALNPIITGTVFPLGSAVPTGTATSVTG